MNQTLDLAERNIVIAFHKLEWVSPIPMEKAIEGVLAYRRNLNETERNLFDAEVERGRHPSLVVETLEVISGRSTQRLERRRKVEAA